MGLFRAPIGVGTFVSTMLAIFLASNAVWAGDDVCKDAGLTGKGFGLCTAYCTAMDCDSESPNANETACGEVQSKFLDTTGLGEMPCGAGTGEPPVADFTCPCDFAVDSWREVLLDYPHQGCQLTTLLSSNTEAFLFAAMVRPPGPGEFLSQVALSTQIGSEVDGLVTGDVQCAATKYDAASGTESYSPKPFGVVYLAHSFEGGRIPMQVGIHEACKRDMQAIIDEFSPGLECVETEVIEVDLSATPSEGPSPLYVQLESNIIGGEEPYTYFWDLGDGETSTSMNPSHTYTISGSYMEYFDVLLTVTDASGEIGIGRMYVTVYPSP